MIASPMVTCEVLNEAGLSGLPCGIVSPSSSAVISMPPAWFGSVSPVSVTVPADSAILPLRETLVVASSNPELVTVPHTDVPSEI